jgi:hypothetical protein
VCSRDTSVTSENDKSGTVGARECGRIPEVRCAILGIMSVVLPTVRWCGLDVLGRLAFEL